MINSITHTLLHYFLQCKKNKYSSKQVTLLETDPGDTMVQ